MLNIGKPYIIKTNNVARLCAKVCLPGEEPQTAWFEVDNEYAEYLTSNCADAFVVGFITTAMRLGANMVCAAPVTRRLLYQLNHYLIPALAANTQRYNHITIHAQAADNEFDCAGAVGTGCSGGADCFYTLMKYIKACEPSHRLTHLLVANCGTCEGVNPEAEFLKIAKRAEIIAAEHNLAVVKVNSNLHLLLKEHYLSVAAFRLPACVLAVQKLFGIFLNSSSYEFAHFFMAEENSAYYELLVLNCLETNRTVFYSAGGHASRIQKLKELSDYPFSWDHLHPCISANKNNCGTCVKCIHTQAALYALGTLNRFSKVFDVDAFYSNIDWFLGKLLYNKNNQHCKEVLVELKKQGITLSQEAIRKARILNAAKNAAFKHKNNLLKPVK